MKLVAILHQARDRLGASPDDDAPALRRAYRRAVRQHPPDRDPQEFQRVRAAYELLQDPVAAIRQRLARPLPLVDPPRPPASKPSAPRGATALGMLRLAVTGLAASDLLPPEVLEPAARVWAGSAPRNRSRSARAGNEPTTAQPAPGSIPDQGASKS